MRYAPRPRKVIPGKSRNLYGKDIYMLAHGGGTCPHLPVEALPPWHGWRQLAAVGVSLFSFTQWDAATVVPGYIRSYHT